MATTTNFGWETPDDTDLVKDGAAAIRTALGGVDTSFVDLKGGTTGQVLAKASATDLDFSWVAQDDSNAIQNAIMDAKGDLIGATAADTPARLAVGANGTVLTADSAEATGLKWAASASGGLTLISTSTPSGATGVDFTSLDSSYKEFFIEWNGIYCGDGTTFDFRFNADSGSNYDAKGFSSLSSSVSAVQVGGTSTWGTPGIIGTHIAGNAYANTSRGWIHIYNATGTSAYKTYKHMNSHYDGSSGWRVTSGVGYYASTAAISQINIARIAGSGTLSTLSNGGIRIWGGK